MRGITNGPKEMIRMQHTFHFSRGDFSCHCLLFYQFTAASPKDAEEWVQQLKFVLQGKSNQLNKFLQSFNNEYLNDLDLQISKAY